MMHRNSRAPLRLLLVTDGNTIPNWLFKCVENLERSGAATCVTVLQAAPADAPGPFRFLQGSRRLLFWLSHNVRPERRPENAIDAGLLGSHRRETEHRNAPLYSPEEPEQDGVALRVRCTHRSPLRISQPESCLLEDVRRLGEERSDAVGRSRRFPREARGGCVVRRHEEPIPCSGQP